MLVQLSFCVRAARRAGALHALQGFLGEAERLTTLWGERWQALLGELEADVGRRCVALQVRWDGGKERQK